MSTLAKTGVLVMAYGSPVHRQDIARYYTHIRGGQPPAADALAELERRYAAIGGSQLAGITQQQAQVLADHLNHDAPNGTFLPFVGFKHAPPFIEDAVITMREAGVTRFVAVAMAPQYSAFSVEGYVRRAAAAARRAQLPMAAAVRSWCREPGFIRYWADGIRRVGARAAGDRARGAVIFTAHSLPTRILAQKDPYPTEVADSARAIARAAGIRHCALAWQSAGRTDEPWLGPAADAVLRRLHAEGIREFVFCPMGFVADHLEVLYDDDVVYRGLSESLGATYRRVPMPNADAGFMAAPARAVRNALRDAQAVAA